MEETQMTTKVTTQVRRDDERQRYEISVDGEIAGFADFSERGDTVIFPHTEISSGKQGRGLAAQLVRAALDDVRSRGQKVVPSCWYVARYIDGHPAYADLVAS